VKYDYGTEEEARGPKWAGRAIEKNIDWNGRMPDE
jgi:hypothetical protein